MNSHSHSEKEGIGRSFFLSPRSFPAEIIGDTGGYNDHAPRDYIEAPVVAVRIGPNATRTLQPDSEPPSRLDYFPPADVFPAGVPERKPRPHSFMPWQEPSATSEPPTTRESPAARAPVDDPYIYWTRVPLINDVHEHPYDETGTLVTRYYDRENTLARTVKAFSWEEAMIDAEVFSLSRYLEGEAVMVWVAEIGWVPGRVLQKELAEDRESLFSPVGTTTSGVLVRWEQRQWVDSTEIETETSYKCARRLVFDSDEILVRPGQWRKIRPMSPGEGLEQILVSADFDVLERYYARTGAVIGKDSSSVRNGLRKLRVRTEKLIQLQQVQARAAVAQQRADQQERAAQQEKDLRAELVDIVHRHAVPLAVLAASAIISHGITLPTAGWFVFSGLQRELNAAVEDVHPHLASLIETSDALDRTQQAAEVAHHVAHLHHARNWAQLGLHAVGHLV